MNPFRFLQKKYRSNEYIVMVYRFALVMFLYSAGRENIFCHVPAAQCQIPAQLPQIHRFPGAQPIKLRAGIKQDHQHHDEEKESHAKPLHSEPGVELENQILEALEERPLGASRFV